MLVRDSDCHFYEVMYRDEHGNLLTVGADDYEKLCSFCGEPCSLVPLPLTMGHDLELTLRRWKDGDCSLDEMFKRVNTELSRSYYEAFGTAANMLQVGKAKYRREIGSFSFEPIEDKL